MARSSPSHHQVRKASGGLSSHHFALASPSPRWEAGTGDPHEVAEKEGLSVSRTLEVVPSPRTYTQAGGRSPRAPCPQRPDQTPDV